MLGPDGGHLAELARPASVEGAWEVAREYVWLGGRPLAQLEHPGPAGSAEGHAYYYHLDAIGLPRALTNANQEVVWRAAVQPYGELAEETVPDPLSGRTVVTNLRLPGQYDERLFGPLGLQGPYYNWNRWYLPGVGRYLEPDPIALRGEFNTPYGVDWYGYALQNPLRWMDPWGLGPMDWWDPRFYWDFWKQAGGGAKDFFENYWDMREAWHVGGDKYFHCKANCMASRRGYWGHETAWFISETREWLDENIKRDTQADCNDDRAANSRGRDGIREYERYQSPLTPSWEKELNWRYGQELWIAADQAATFPCFSLFTFSRFAASTAT